MGGPTTPVAPGGDDPAACASATLPPVPEAEQLRHQALSPFLGQFREWVSQLQEPQGIPHFAEIAARPIDLGCWERSVLKQTCAHELPDPRSVELLAECVAYQAKIGQVLGVFSHG